LVAVLFGCVFLLVFCLAAHGQPSLAIDRLPLDAPEEVAQQVERLYSPRSAERGQAAFLLGKMGERAAPAVPFLIGMFGDYAVLQPGFSGTKTSPSEEAARALIVIGKPAFRPLVEALGNEDPDVRREAIWTLGNMQDPRALRPLTEAMQQGEGDTRSQAAMALGWLNDSRAVPPLMAALQDEDTEVRRRAAMALGRHKDPRSVEPLAAALRDREESVVYVAADALANVGRPAVDSLILCLEDDVMLARLGGVLALGQLASRNVRDDRAVEPLIAAMGDEDPKVRTYAVWALGWYRDPGSVPALVEALGDSEAAVRAEAAKALRRSKDARAVDPLLAALEDGDVQVQQNAALTLGQMQERRALPKLVELLKAEDAQIREYAAVALGQLEDARAAEALLGTLNDEEDRV